MTPAQQYDKDKNEVADMFTELDAIDEVYNDLCTAGVAPKLIEAVEEAMHYNEPLDYILSLIPDDIKGVIKWSTFTHHKAYRD
jgi:hypothetical protein